MKTVILSDTHFGIKQNSITWMNSQVNFLYNEFIPYIKELSKKERIQVIHCGDVFDSRSSINPFIATNVRKAFEEIASICPVWIVAGNHDFYSPNEDDVSALDLTLNSIDNLHIIRDKIVHITVGDKNVQNALLVPWYEFDKREILEQAINEYNPKCIFCHTDLTRLSTEYKSLLSGISAYSGHIHTPSKEHNLITLGSTFALTFADCNADRGFYVLDVDAEPAKQRLDFIPARNIIKFWRFYNRAIFDIDVNRVKDDYIELYVNKLDLLNKEYSDQIAFLTSRIHNITVVPNSEPTKVNEEVEFQDYNIEEICRTNIPKQLLDKFNEIAGKN